MNILKMKIITLYQTNNKIIIIKINNLKIINRI